VAADFRVEGIDNFFPIQLQNRAESPESMGFKGLSSS
jgi:hypothetical protein